MSPVIPDEHDGHPHDRPHHPEHRPGDLASGSGATSSERAQAQAVHERSEPERLDGSTGPVEPPE